MYKISEVADPKKLLTGATDQPPFGPGFDSATVAQADRMEVWGTEVDEGKKDYTEFRLVRNGSIIGIARIVGY